MFNGFFLVHLGENMATYGNSKKNLYNSCIIFFNILRVYCRQISKASYTEIRVET